MTTFRNQIGLGIGLIAVIWVVAAGAAVAQEEGHKVFVQKISVECEGGDDDCKTEDVRRIVIKADASHHELGDDHVWVSAGDGDHAVHSAMVERFGGGGSFLGVALTELSPELRTHFGVPDDAGVMVSKVIDGSPAFRAGLQVGDIVTSVDGESVSSGGALSKAIRGRESGETVVLEIWRDGQVQTLSAAVEERKAEDLHRAHRAIFIGCDEDEEDCNVHADVDHDMNFTFDHSVDSSFSLCEDEEECEVEVTCEDGECSCVVNGEQAECKALHLGAHGDGEAHRVKVIQRKQVKD